MNQKLENQKSLMNEAIHKYQKLKVENDKMFEQNKALDLKVTEIGS